MTPHDKIIRQAPLANCAAAFALGIASAKFFGELSFAAALFIIALAAAAHLLFAKKSPAIALAFAALFFGNFYASRRIPQMPYPDFTAREARLEILVKSASQNEKGASCGIGKILSASENFKDAEGFDVWFYAKNSEPLFRGEKIKGEFVARQAEKNGGFGEYLQSQNIFFNAYTPEKIEVSQAAFPYSFYKKIRLYIGRKLGLCRREGGSSAARAIVLGDKSALGAAEKQNFRLTGTMHIFAVSGLHVGMLAGLVYFALRLLRVSARAKPFASLPILFLYVNVCGAPPSAMRAFIMIAAVWLACAFRRKPKPFAGLVAAFLTTLLINPSCLFDAGFALSYSVVAAIILYAIPLSETICKYLDARKGFELKRQNFFKRFCKKARDYAVIGLCIGLAAFFASAPLCSCFFGYVPLLSALYSVPFVLGATAALGFGVLAVASPAALAYYFSAAAAFILEIMLRLANFGASFGIVLNVKIPMGAALLGEFAILAALMQYPKIQNGAKWLLPPSISALALLCAAI